MIDARTARLAASDAIANVHTAMVVRAESGADHDPYLLTAMAQTQATAALALAALGVADQRCRSQLISRNYPGVLRCERDVHDKGEHLGGGESW